jgi:hypothetical protein
VEYVEGLEAAEEAEPACVDNRLQLEKAWQVVANEFFDPHAAFSQAAWAAQLHNTLLVRACGSLHGSLYKARSAYACAYSQSCIQGAGGCLHNRADTYRALKGMMASLGDRYTEFLVPTRVRSHTCCSFACLLPGSSQLHGPIQG